AFHLPACIRLSNASVFLAKSRNSDFHKDMISAVESKNPLIKLIVVQLIYHKLILSASILSMKFCSFCVHHVALNGEAVKSNKLFVIARGAVPRHVSLK
ncbi:MAG: hypothetical protein K2G28_00295, partial [Acetatifactor sp.]|nr:hypothetical protein [Acetatifactor sp.]